MHIWGKTVPPSSDTEGVRIELAENAKVLSDYDKKEEIIEEIKGTDIAEKKELVKEAMEIFFDVRKVPGLKKKPSTSELIDWLKLLMADDIPEEILRNRDTSKAIPPLYGALVKNEQDVALLERLAFMNRRQSGSSKG